MSSPLLPSPLFGLPMASLHALRGALLRDAGWSYVGWLTEMGWAGAGDAVGAFAGWLASQGETRAVDALDAATFQQHAAAFFAAAGWGQYRIAAFGDGLLAVDTTDGVEADPSAQLPYPGCYVTGGLLAGFFSAIGGVTLTSLEVQCRSTGAPFCRWLVGSPESIQLVYDALSRGESLESVAETLAAP